MSKDNILYLSFDENLEEIREFYTDITSIKKGLTKRKEAYIKSGIKELEQCLNFIFDESWIKDGISYLGDWDPEYLLLGHFFEGLLRLVLMKEVTVDEFFEKCYIFHPNDHTKDRFKTLRPLTNILLQLPKIVNLTSKQQKRVEDALAYITLQRNKHAHFHPKGYDSYAVRFEIYLLLKKLLELFEINFTKETMLMVSKTIDRNKVQSGMIYGH